MYTWFDPEWIGFWLLPPVLLGVLVFHADQRNNAYRFLVHRGVSGHALWRSRQIVPGLLALIWAVITVVAMIRILDAQAHSIIAEWVIPVPRVCGALVVVALLSYAIGQACSQELRSGMVAGAVAVGLSALAGLWSALLLIIPSGLAWLVCGLPVLPLVYAYRRSPVWGDEHVSVKPPLQFLGVLFAALAAITTLVAVNRIHGVPPPGSTWQLLPQPMRAMSSSAQTAADFYIRAVPLTTPVFLPPTNRVDDSGFSLRQFGFPMQSTPDETKNRKNRTELFGLLHEAGDTIASDGYRFALDDQRIAGLRSRITRVQWDHVIEQGVDDALDTGDLDEAWRRAWSALQFSVFLLQDESPWALRVAGVRIQVAALRAVCRWAAQPDLRPERLAYATDSILKVLIQVAPPSRCARHAFAEWKAALDGAPANATMRIMPWESVRLRRLLSSSAAKELAIWKELERSVRGILGGNFPPDSPGLENVAAWEWSFSEGDWLTRWLLEKSAPRSRSDDITVPVQVWAQVHELMITYQRVWRTAMLIQQWRVVHGSLPPSLGALDRSTVSFSDACYARPILYLPDGTTDVESLQADYPLSESAFIRHDPDAHGSVGALQVKSSPFLVSYGVNEGIDLVPDPTWTELREGRGQISHGGKKGG